MLQLAKFPITTLAFCDVRSSVLSGDVATNSILTQRTLNAIVEHGLKGVDSPPVLSESSCNDSALILRSSFSLRMFVLDTFFVQLISCLLRSRSRTCCSRAASFRPQILIRVLKSLVNTTLKSPAFSVFVMGNVSGGIVTDVVDTESSGLLYFLTLFPRLG